MNQPIKYHGGKHYLASWIISQMPKHLHYVEPFFGGGSVLLEKNPHGTSEVVSDLDGRLTNFWRVLREPSTFEQFARVVAMTPFSNQFFNESMDRINEFLYGSGIDINAAVDFFILARQSRQGLMKDFATLSRNRVRRGMNEQVSSWLSAIEGLPEVHKRLKQVVILTDDFVKIIKSQDGPNTLFYLDPPYLHETRRTVNDYKYELSPARHEELLNLCGEMKGKFLLSGYRSQLYQDYQDEFGWSCAVKEIDNKASSAEVKEIKEECLWRNF